MSQAGHTGKVGLHALPGLFPLPAVGCPVKKQLSALAWAGFKSATRAAAAGGVTTFVDMPLNNAPTTTSAELLTAKRRAAKVVPLNTLYGLRLP